MVQPVVDLGPDRGGVAEGDRAVLLGAGTHGEPTALEWAYLAATKNNEIQTGVRRRPVPRYIGSV